VKIMEDNKNLETGCCPKFNPEPWNDKEIVWENKLFVKDCVKSFFHIPLNFGKIMTKNMEKIKLANVFDSEMIVMTDEKSLWGSDVYISVSKDAPELEIVKISGTFLTKVFEGSYKNMGNWIKEMQGFVKSKEKEIKKMFFFYTTCPKCAKIYGKNYTVILVQIK